MNERIKAIRKALKISQEKFGKRIHISGASVSKIESGENNPSERTISLICASFNVNEKWLRTGIGDNMFNQPDGDSIDSIVKQYDFPDIVRKLVETYDQLDREERAVMTAFTRKFLASLVPDPIEKKVMDYRAELEAEKREKTLSASRTEEERKTIS